MACLETSFIIDLLRGKAEVKSLKDELDKNERILSVTAPSVMELWTGALMSTKAQMEKSKIQELLQSLEMLPLDEKSAKAASEIEVDLLRGGLPIDIQDMMIAGIAHVNGETLVTRDQHFARVPGLRLLKY